MVQPVAARKLVPGDGKWGSQLQVNHLSLSLSLMAETADQPLQPINHKTCILKASIHCEGCKRKVKKILTQLQGVDFVEVDTKQQRVTVTGSVYADALIKKLVKSGKHAEVWPQKVEKEEKISGHGRNEEKETQTQSKIDQPNLGNAAKELHPSVKAQLAANNYEGSGGAAKVDRGRGGAAAAGFKKKKSECKKTEEACSGEGKPLQEAAKKSDACGGGEGGTDGKKKKKKGKSGNLYMNAPSSAAPACTGSESRVPSPPLPTNHSSPSHPHTPPPHHYYTHPPPPAYAVSYNTAYPSNSYTTSYYAAPPPYSYAYAYPGAGAEPPPLDHELHPRQPLDSFEIFSDENPNGCSIA
ncbi:hypothetical protein Pfo_005249 [Paulownia fortunei]|nr:hypothetical protein Pfo_005249 [Paulownia fortunei]